MLQRKPACQTPVLAAQISTPGINQHRAPLLLLLLVRCSQDLHAQVAALISTVKTERWEFDLKS